VMPAQQLGTSRGMHRWIWDLRRTRPHAPRYGYPISAAPHATVRTPEGARVAPGTYTVRLTVDGQAFTTKISVALDPRIKLPAAAIAKQNQVETQVAELLDRASAATLEAQSVIDQLTKLAPKDVKDPKDPALVRQIVDATAKLTLLLNGVRGKRDPAAPEVPTLSASARELADLYAQVQVDAAPTAAQVAAARTYEHELTTLLASWKTFQTDDLAKLGAALAAAKLPAIDIKKQPTTEQTGGDEE